MQTATDVFFALLLCGLMGVLGQGVRATVGLKRASRLETSIDQQTAFSAAYFALSLMIGFIAGVLAGLAIGIQEIVKIDPNNLKVLIGIAAAGYAGADFIENSLAIVVPAKAAPTLAPETPKIADALDTQTKMLSEQTITLREAIRDFSRLSAEAPARTAANTFKARSFGPAMSRVAPHINLSKWEHALDEAFKRYDINTNRRIAAAIGQFMVEAGQSFEEVVEKMNYRAARMVEVWTKTFKTLQAATPYEHNEQKLGNFIYANKLGNGNEASGDGFRFRGRGLIQLTGRNEYTEFAKAVGMTADEASAYCETPEGAAISGCWYLSTRNCLPAADVWDLKRVTRLVNGQKMLDHEKRAQFSDKILAELERSS
jgi:predicted chitinase